MQTEPNKRSWCKTIAALNGDGIDFASPVRTKGSKNLLCIYLSDRHDLLIL